HVGLDAAAHALAQDDADSIVVSNQIVLNDAAAAEVFARPPWIHSAWTGLRRVVEEAAIQMAGVRAQILEVECRSGPELGLDVDAPLILAGVGQIASGRDHVRRGDRTRHTGGARER